MTRPLAQQLKEFSAKVGRLPTRQQKADLIKQLSYSSTFLTIFMLAFSPDLHFDLPRGHPEGLKFTRSADNEGWFQNHLTNKKHLYFLKNMPSQYKVPTVAKKQMMFFNALEQMHPDDANLYLSIKDKVFPFPGIEYADLEAAFPNIFPESGRPSDLVIVDDAPKGENKPLGSNPLSTPETKMGVGKPNKGKQLADARAKKKAAAEAQAKKEAHNA